MKRKFQKGLALLLALALFSACGASRSDKMETNTDARYYDLKEFKTLMKEDSDFLYRHCLAPYEKEMQDGTYIIPGLKQTVSLAAGKPSLCRDTTPQGVTCDDEHLYISAYCYEHLHNSVIYVINKKTHKYEKTLITPGLNHLGGIAWDDDHECLWLATHIEGESSASAILKTTLDAYRLDGRDPDPIRYDHTTLLPDLTENSFLTVHYGRLWCGTFVKTGTSIIESFLITGPGEVDYESKHRQTISASCQGIAIYGDTLFLTDSDGPHQKSKLHLFKLTKKSLRNKKEYKSYSLPPRLEQIWIDGGHGYIIFESAANAYAPRDFTKIDRVLSLDIRSVIDK